MDVADRPTHYFTVDVEDYFQVSSFDSLITREAWGDQESRVVQNTNRMLDLLNKHGVKGIFFVLGWVANRFPDLVRRIAEGGHVIGCHTFWHRLIYQQTPMEFAMDLAQCCEVLRDVTGTEVQHFRAPSFSITHRSLWALEYLKKQGILWDSSIVPVRHDRYGIPGSPSGPYQANYGGVSLQEFPVSIWKLGKASVPVGGGGYFRIFPWWFMRHAYRKLEEAGVPIHFYIHPWEIDPDQPKVKGAKALSRFRHYRNLDKTYDRLDRMLSQFRFGNTTYPQSKTQYQLG